MTSVAQGTRGALRSLAVAFPSVLRTNEHWRTQHPELIARVAERSVPLLWGGESGPTLFERKMAPHAGDPFRGSVERRHRAPGETALSIEAAAARGALAAAGLGVGEVDLTLTASFPGDRFAVGNAPFLAAELGLETPAWNFESACSSAIVGVHMASSLIRSGEYERILVVVSTSNSALSMDTDNLSWLSGDGAGAMVIERSEGETGVLGHKTINTVVTNDMFVIHSTPTRDGGTRLTSTTSPNAGALGRDTAEPCLRECVSGALESAGLAATDVDFWVFNTPNAWYGDVCAEVLGLPPDSFLSVYPRYGNIGAALMPATLHEALRSGRTGAGERVLCYSIGSTSTASAVVLRLGDVALGPAVSAAASVDGPSMASVR